MGLKTIREVARHYGIKRVHDAGANQGISHHVIADNGYALPGTVLANPESHTVAAGAFNCVARTRPAGVAADHLHRSDLVQGRTPRQQPRPTVA